MKSNNYFKYAFLFISLLCFVAYSFEQRNVRNTELYGEITGLTDSVIVIQYDTNKGSQSDSILVNNGKFHWAGNIPEPERVRFNSASLRFFFFIEKGKMMLKMNVNDEKSLTIQGCNTQNELELFEKSLDPLNKEIDVLNTVLESLPEDSSNVELSHKIDNLLAKKQQFRDEYIAKHPNSFVGADFLMQKALDGNVAEVKDLFLKLSPEMRQSNIGNNIDERIKELERSSIGSAAIQFSLNNIEGKPVSFSQFKGKYVLINFWASWCAPCRGENPNVLKAYNAYKNKNFDIIGISLDSNKENWESAVKKDGLPWTQLSDLKGFKNAVSSYYGIKYIPSNLLISPSGIIIAKNLRDDLLQKKLAEIFP